MKLGGAPADSESGSERSAAGNAAWAETEISLSARDAFIFLSNIERLFRLNPYLDISQWHQQDGLRPSCVMIALNEMNGCRYEVRMDVEVLGENLGIRLLYDRGLKASTEFRIAPLRGGSSLTITEHYHPVKDEQDERLKEVDRSLVPWLAAIRGHVAGLVRYGWLPGYRWWVGRFMPGMPPRQRRMVRLLVWVSLFEFLVFLFVAAVFWLERQRG